MNFKDKVVIVTGGSSGIGAATAIQFAKESAKVAIVGRNESKLASVEKACQKFGVQPLVIVADLTKDSDVKSIVEKTISHFGKLDVLVNNAGMTTASGSIHDPKFIENYDTIMTTNLRSVCLITHLAVPELIKSKGNIVNVSSVLSTSPGKPIIYGTSKAAMDHFTRCSALELAKDGIRVNCVNPGPVRTDFIINLGVDEKTSDKMWEQVGEKTPLKGVCESEEVADLILYLASNKAKSITGATFPIDHGTLLIGCGALSI